MAKKSANKASTKVDTKDNKDIAVSKNKKHSTVVKTSDVKKDNIKSKKTLTPYFKFMKEQRPLVTKQHPELSNKEMIVELAKRWRSLSSTDKDKYKNK